MEGLLPKSRGGLIKGSSQRGHPKPPPCGLVPVARPAFSLVPVGCPHPKSTGQGPRSHAERRIRSQGEASWVLQSKALRAWRPHLPPRQCLPFWHKTPLLEPLVGGRPGPAHTPRDRPAGGGVPARYVQHPSAVSWPPQSPGPTILVQVRLAHSQSGPTGHSQPPGVSVCPSPRKEKQTCLPEAADFILLT